jgi:DNA (cytosine-5)-methyltransferase 1
VRYLSICSGIEAASVAWHGLGWTPLAFSEIDAFPRAVLAHHYPDVPCHGDFTRLRDEPWIADADVLVGGTPCQAFSVAGLRNSLSDERGNLSLEFVRLADAIDTLRSDGGGARPPSIIVWENVPGVLSVRDNAFGCFLAALAGDVAPYVPPRGKWTDAGVVAGPQRQVAWRVLDAQYFGLAQRRRRVFVVASARDGFDPAAVLLEFEGVRRDTPPRREKGQDSAGGARPSAAERSSHWDGLEHPHPTLNQSFNTGAIGYSNQELFSQRGAGLVQQPSTGDISHCLNAGGMGRLDYETETLVAHTLKAEGFDASEDGTGRGTPLVPVELAYPLDLRNAGRDPEKHDEVNRQGLGVGEDGDPSPTISTAFVPGVAYGFQPRIARNGRGDMGDLVNALNAQSGETGKGDAAPCVAIINDGENHGPSSETNSVEALRALRRAVGEEAFTVWGFGVLASLQSQEVLQSALHGCGLRYPAFSRSWVVCCALGSSKHGSGWLLQSLRETGCAGCPPQGWEPSEQLAGELGAYLSELSQPTSSAESFMRDLWLASEGPGLLQQALAAVQEARRPSVHQIPDKQPLMAVRRLTATECEFLQGFPRGYTMIPWKKKPASECPDGPRYKALGNSMAVPVMRWIGQRIDAHLRSIPPCN